MILMSYLEQFQSSNTWIGHEKSGKYYTFFSILYTGNFTFPKMKKNTNFLRVIDS